MTADRQRACPQNLCSSHGYSLPALQPPLVVQYNQSGISPPSGKIKMGDAALDKRDNIAWQCEGSTCIVCFANQGIPRTATGDDGQ